MVFADTSALLNGCANNYDEIWTSPLVVSELENIKTSATKDSHIKFLARQTVRDILFNEKYLTCRVDERKIDRFIHRHPTLREDLNDHRILAAAALLQKETGEQVEFLTSDGAQYLAAWSVDVAATFYEIREEKEEYCGWRKVAATEEQLSMLYSDPSSNVFDARTNEFIEICVNDEIKDVQFWDGQRYRNLKYQNFKTPLGEKIQPRNLEQKMYLDLLQNKNVPIKLCIGRFGSGKSLLALTYALYEIQVTGRFDKIVFVKNNLSVKGAGQLAAVPGDEVAKQYPWLRQIEDHIGFQRFEEYLEAGIIEPAHLATLRGRDLKNSVILVDEAENLLTTNIQLLLGRVAENSEIIFCADVKQCDYANEKMSGIPKLIERLAGNELFGMVKLLKAERSRVAATADLLD